MAPKPRATRKASGYLPLPLFEYLEKRVERNFSSVSHELIAIVSQALEQEKQREQREEVTA